MRSFRCLFFVQPRIAPQVQGARREGEGSTGCTDDVHHSEQEIFLDCQVLTAEILGKHIAEYLQAECPGIESDKAYPRAVRFHLGMLVKQTPNLSQSVAQLVRRSFAAQCQLRVEENLVTATEVLHVHGGQRTIR